MEKDKCESGMDYVTRQTGELFDRLNADGVRAAIVVLHENGVISTRQTDAFTSITDYCGIWDVGKFQVMNSLWQRNPHLGPTTVDREISARSSGNKVPL